MSPNEMEHYIEQLEAENLRLKQTNKSLRTNNQGLLTGHQKLQRSIHHKNKIIDELITCLLRKLTICPFPDNIYQNHCQHTDCKECIIKNIQKLNS